MNYKEDVCLRMLIGLFNDALIIYLLKSVLLSLGYSGWTLVGMTLGLYFVKGFVFSFVAAFITALISNLRDW